MHYYLIIQYPYETVDIGLCRNGKIVKSIHLHKFDAVGKTITSIQELLISENLKFSDISFFGVNVGPGPYNTLRAILTIINGIHRVNQIPMIELNALDLMGLEQKDTNYLIVLNAFENHLFFKIKNSTEIYYGANSVTEIINRITLQPDELLIQGNGAIKYNDLFKNCSKIIWPTEIISFNRLDTLAQAGYEKFLEQKISTNYLKPIYFEDLATNK